MQRDAKTYGELPPPVTVASRDQHREVSRGIDRSGGRQNSLCACAQTTVHRAVAERLISERMRDGHEEGRA
jgi:hypothetical protein